MLLGFAVHISQYMLLGTPVIPGTLKPGRKRITSLGKIATSCIEKKFGRTFA